MKMQITGFEPALSEVEKDKHEEFVNVAFMTTMKSEEFHALLKKTKQWGVEVDFKKRKE